MIHVLLRYLGIKTKLLSNIRTEIEKISQEGDIVLDLFGGSNIVGQNLSDIRRIYSNDIQKYSYVVAQATLNINKNFDYKKININKVEESNYYRDNYEKLTRIFNLPLKYERDIIPSAAKDFSYDNLLKLKELYENTPYVGNYKDKIDVFRNLEKYYNVDFYNSLKEEKEYMLFTLNYAMPYFSLNQSIFIDSFRCAIENMHLNKEISDTEYYIYLSLLIYGLENSVSSIGDHFAQPQIFKLLKEKKHQKGLEKLISKKQVNLHDCMLEKQKEFNNIDINNYYDGNKCFNEDCNILLDSNYMNMVKVAYIDPPYTNAHYSRFYHILETLVNYDYPEIEFNGRYSKNRFQSAFCQKKQASIEFEKMIEKCSKKGIKLVISYSDTSQCLISYDEIKEICKKYYKDVKINKIDYLYRNLGQKPNKVKGNELLIVCQEVK